MKGGIRSLLQISGVGRSIAEKIEEFLKTGQIRYYEELKKKMPVDLEGLSQIEGLGPKRIKNLWQALRIHNLEELQKAAKSHKICKVPGFQERTEQNILKSIEFSGRDRGRYALGFALPLINEIETRLRSIPEVNRVAVAGSVRRMKETIGDADFLVASDSPKRVTEYFISMPEVESVQAKGAKRSTVRLQSGMHCDLRIVPDKSFGSALQYFTGSKEHNIGLRTIAVQNGLKLNEYGMFMGKRRIAGRTEEEIYKLLGMTWIPPELRENWAEIEAARRGQLPKLVGYADLKGDLQVHTNWTDGKNSILEMAEAAKQCGLEYIAITDHTKSLAMTKGLDEKELEEQAEEIANANDNIEGIRLLKGAEVNISKNGSLDVTDNALEKLDVVGAAIHSHFNLSKEDQTKRIVSAISNPNVDILFHPTGRIIKQREAYPIDISKVIDVAVETRTVLEVDAFPERLDLNDECIRLAVQGGCKISVDSDAHTTSNLQLVKFGIGQARRGWARAQDVVNTLNLTELLSLLKR